jgi:hypothetical protein
MCFILNCDWRSHKMESQLYSSSHLHTGCQYSTFKSVSVLGNHKLEFTLQFRYFTFCVCSMQDTLQTSNSNKAIPITGRGGLQGCEMLRIPHHLDIRLIDGSKVVSPTHRSHFTPQKLFFMFPVLISVRG